MNTTENNRLIAEFMGYSCDDPNEESCTFETPYMVNISDMPDWETDVNDWTNCLRADEMLFHKSWDWLMPVVDKVSEIAHDTGVDHNIELWMFMTGEIEAVYAKVIEFIQWYNNQNQ